MKSQYIVCPNQAPLNYEGVKLFLAGGISFCPDWQALMAKCLIEKVPERLAVIDPRRESFDISNREISKEQIRWEREHLEQSNIVTFWFPKETLCPITLYELGRMTMKWQTKCRPANSVIDAPVEIVIGIEPGYQREFDIREQTRLCANTNQIRIVNSIDELIDLAALETKWIIKNYIGQKVR